MTIEYESQLERALDDLKEASANIPKEMQLFALRGIQNLTDIYETLASTATMTRKHRYKFDGNKAREMRVQSGMSITDLVWKLDFPEKQRKAAENAISKYETGKVTPRYPPVGEIPRRYLTGLAEETGYDPYKLLKKKKKKLT